MKVGIGYSSEEDPYQAAGTAASEATQRGKISRPDFVLAFSSGALDCNDFFSGLKSVIGDNVPIVGGTTTGIITNEFISYDGYSVGVAAIESEKFSYDVFSASDIDKDERLAGQNLGEHFKNASEEDLLLLFFDIVKQPATSGRPPILNSAGAILQGIRETLTNEVPIVGGGFVKDHSFNSPTQFCGTHVDNQNAIGLLLSGEHKKYHQIMHGCTPQDGIYHTITRVDGHIVYEVDGKSIVEIINKKYGNENWQDESMLRRLTIGVNLGDRYDFDEGNYINRAILGPLPNKEGIVVYQPDLEVGTEFQFMLRDSQRMLESARNNSQKLLEQIVSEGRTPLWGFYVDCAGRTAKRADLLTEEASEVQTVFNGFGVPLLGFYSGCEIAPLLGKSRTLDWTGVLTVFAM
ncbi:MAG: hypothetical protein GY847_35765 [Proteobacteria bacterium]|nr:hypothetical protein [Pseudomonadota bacterium]